MYRMGRPDSTPYNLILKITTIKTTTNNQPIKKQTNKQTTTISGGNN